MNIERIRFRIGTESPWPSATQIAKGQQDLLLAPGAVPFQGVGQIQSRSQVDALAVVSKTRCSLRGIAEAHWTT